jgi:serine/threonine-protein kinase
VPADPNAPPQPNAVKELAFDLTAPPWKGDLGRFLKDQVKPGDARVHVRVTGSGPAALGFTPVRLPDGTSLEIIVENTRVRVSVPPIWRPINVGSAEALIDVRGGELVLNGVEIQREANSRPKYLVRVEDGHLVLNRCRLTYPPGQRIGEPGTGHLISFRAPTSRPLTNRSWPFSSPIDKPVCRMIDSVLIASGDVLHAEVGRGMIALTQCLLEAGGTIFALNPAKVARNRFEADLWIERCTLAAEKTFVFLGPWPGTTPGPDRPWLVSSRASAYLGSFTPVSKESVLLRVEPNSLSQGTLFWQGSNDAY